MAFADELAVLKGGSVAIECTTVIMLANALPKHQRAYVELWCVLDRAGKRQLEKKWKTYLYGQGNRWNKEKFIYLASPHYGTEESSMELAVHHIEKLVS
ncbi:hypothetical protein JFN90_08405 [Geomonas sp. Red259]|uniref:Uncharacterized protein n=1 Tax=Geomonas propionica TaxID=2798582 RepID=A0ABS0YQ93_9BACT|nr:hypothetical protein [Geomonas propionica]